MEDTNYGIKLVLITNSTILLIRNFPSNGKSKSKRIMVAIYLGELLIFGNAESTGAKDNWFLPGAERFSISRPVQSSRGYSLARGTSGQNPGGGSGENPNPSSGSKNGSCSSNPTPKITPEVMQ